MPWRSTDECGGVQPGFSAPHGRRQHEAATSVRARHDPLGGIYVFDPNDGRLLQFLPVPTDEVTNCALGGPDARDLFITARSTLYRVRTTTPGRVWSQNSP